MLRLVDTADVFLTNLRPDAVERLGLGPVELLERNPRLVYAMHHRLRAHRARCRPPGYDVGAFWARTGMARSFTPEDEPPGVIRGGMGDHVTALALVAGINAALLARERTGQGQLVDTSLLRAGHLVRRLGHRHPAAVREAGPDAAPHRDDEPDRQPLPGR